MLRVVIEMSSEETQEVELTGEWIGKPAQIARMMIAFGEISDREGFKIRTVAKGSKLDLADLGHHLRGSGMDFCWRSE